MLKYWRVLLVAYFSCTCYTAPSWNTCLNGRLGSAGRWVLVVCQWRYEPPIPFSLNEFPSHQTLSLLLHKINTSAVLITVCSFDRRWPKVIQSHAHFNHQHVLQSVGCSRAVNKLRTTLVVRFPGPLGQLGEGPKILNKMQPWYSKKIPTT